EWWGEEVDGGRGAAESIALVDLERDAGRRVRQRRPERVGLGAPADEGRGALGHARGRQLRQRDVLGLGAARDDRAEGVEQYELGRVNRGSGQGAEAHRGAA